MYSLSSMEFIEAFKELANIYQQHGYKLYMVGGTSRDFLLKRELHDFDCCSDALPSEANSFLKDADMVFAKYGTIIYKFQGFKFEITTFREEKSYSDYRHPSDITFIKDESKDYLRRDFTINALYIDEELKIHDFGSGIMDLSGHLIRMIGDPKKRLKEDPLRILRAIRFAMELDFDIEESLTYAMKDLAYLIARLNPFKVEQEINKALKAGIDERELRKTLKMYNVLLKKKV